MPYDILHTSNSISFTCMNVNAFNTVQADGIQKLTKIELLKNFQWNKVFQGSKTMEIFVQADFDTNIIKTSNKEDSMQGLCCL